MNPLRIPKLRFPGFSDDWEEKKLGDLSIKVGSGSTPRGGGAVYQHLGIPFIRSQNVAKGKLNMHDVVYIDQQTHNNMSNSRIKPKDVLLNITGASLGRTCIVPDNFVDGNLSQHVCIIRLVPGVSPYLVHTLLSLPAGLHELLKTQTGGGKEGLNFQAVRSFKVTIPEKDEQERIAGFLSIIDDKISAIQHKKEQLEKYKEGITKNIFSQKIRFNDENGNEYRAWQQKTLGECLTYEQPTKYLVSSTDYNDTFNIPVLTAGKTFILGYTNETYGVYENNLPIIIFDDFTTATQFVDFPFKAKSSAMKILSAKKGYDIKFIFESMKLLKYEVGGHERHWVSKYAHLSIPVPSSEEQKRIAAFLDALDDKIELEEGKLEQAQKFKKALLQEMFV